MALLVSEKSKMAKPLRLGEVLALIDYVDLG
jgi:hypothetical protein